MQDLVSIGHLLLFDLSYRKQFSAEPYSCVYLEHCFTKSHYNKKTAHG